MNSRTSRPATRSQAALIHRGPQASTTGASAHPHAPNAALLIDFDNVTMGIRSDLGKELRSLLSSEIIKGKVAVQRAYADWRRYPQYIVPLSESSIDLIFAPAYGSSKKNATDIRLAIDAMELVFTRPEIGTFILLSGDSDFSSMVMKLKEYGKYVIGVGIRESSSDLLVQNCDEYYSYNALAGLVKASDEEPARKWDPWELVGEAAGRMKTNGDVMRSDRLKQVMQDIDSSFDEKNLNMAKFSRFVQEAANRGLITVTKLDNGQLEIDLPKGDGTAVAPAASPSASPASSDGPSSDSAGRPRRGRRGGRGRGRDRDREERPAVSAASTPVDSQAVAVPDTSESVPMAAVPDEVSAPPRPAPAVAVDVRSDSPPPVGHVGDLLSRSEAFDLVKRAVESLTQGDAAVRASAVRARARELLGRDSQSLSERMFIRVLKDSHDAGKIDLRRRGDDFDVARAADAESVADQAARAERLATPAAPVSTGAPMPRVGMGPRGSAPRGRFAALPPELLSIGVVNTAPAPVAAPAANVVAAEPVAAPPAKKGRAAVAKKAPAKKAKAVATPAAAAPAVAAPKAKRAPAAKAGARKKAGAASE